MALVVDVRSFPRSRSNPIYNIDTLPELQRDDQDENTPDTMVVTSVMGL